MKKSILLILFVFALLACQAQVQSIITTRPGADNMKSGGTKINNNFIYVDGRIDTIKAAIADTSDLLTEIEALPYIKLPVLTQTQINALTPATGMFVLNSTSGYITYYSNGAWREIALLQ